LQKLEKILEKTGRQRLFRVLLIHHPPVPGPVSWRKRLTDGGPFRSVLARHGVELILHGHAHRTAHTELETVTGRALAVGVPSASAFSRNPQRCARYHLYHLRQEGRGWKVMLSVRGYSPAEGCFVAQGEERLM
jgi:hypothetical protein